MQDQSVLELDMKNLDHINSDLSSSHSFEVAKENNAKPSKYTEKNQKIYSENDSKRFENILLRHIEKMKEKSITRNQLLTQHKETLLQLFNLGATIDEVLHFLKENNFTGITAENLKEFSKKRK